MSAGVLEHAPSGLQVYYWMGSGAALALLGTVYKWIWRALGHLGSRMLGPPSLRDYPVWRPPEPAIRPEPEVEGAEPPAGPV